MPLLEGKCDPQRMTPDHIGPLIARAIITTAGQNPAELRWVDVAENFLQHAIDAGIIR